jgi:ubiquinone/menaquinone biosynthesis C-methylase UbiE
MCWQVQLASSSDKTQEFFSNRALKHKEIPKYLFEKTWAILDEHTNVYADLSVLDAGCGAGAWSRRFKEKNCEVTGLDFSEGMLKLAKSLDRVSRYCRGNLFNLPVYDDAFDVVFFGYVLHHFTKHDIGKILREALRVVKKNGVVASIDPNLVNPYNFLKIHPLSPFRDNINHIPHEKPLTFKDFEECHDIFHRTYFHTMSFIPSLKVDASKNVSRTFFTTFNNKLEELPFTSVFGSNIVMIGKKNDF